MITEILNWITNNIGWLLSVGGGGMVIAIIYVIFPRFFLQFQRSGKQATNLQAGRDINL